MKENKVTSLSLERGETPEAKAMQDIVNPVASYAHLGELRAVAVIGLRNGDKDHVAALAPTERDRRELIALLEQIKHDLLNR